MLPAPRLSDVKNIRKQIRQRGSDDRAEPDEKTLHREAARALKFRQQVGHKRAEGLHADVDAGIEHPQESGRHPERRTARHEDQRRRAQNRARQKIRTTTSKRTPRPVAGVADDRLHDQSRERRGQPKNRNLIGPRAQVFVDGAHIGHLQSPAKLDAEEAEAHVPDLPKGAGRLVHADSIIRINLQRVIFFPSRAIRQHLPHAQFEGTVKGLCRPSHSAPTCVYSAPR